MSFINLFQLNKTPLQSNQSSSSSSSSSTMPQCCPTNEQKGKSKLNRSRPSALPELLNQNSNQELAQSDNSTILEGIITNIKLILKLLQEHKDSSKPDEITKPHPLAKILAILDDVRPRIELICSYHSCRRRPSDGLSPRSPKPRPSTFAEENQKLRRELSVSLTARKSLEKMFSSLGREKEMIATELARRVQELSCMEELVSDLRADNSKLTEKLKAWREIVSGGGGMEMKEKNRELSEKLLKAMDGYKMAKRRMREAKEENERLREEVELVVERMRRVRERRGEGEEEEEEEMEELEKLLEKLAKAGLPPQAD